MVLIQDPNEIVRIKLKRKTREELKQYGVKGETYEIIIRRLMKGWIGGSQITTTGEKIHNLEQFCDGDLVGPRAKKGKRM